MPKHLLLKDGWTTGTTATAAVVAALRYAREGKVPTEVDLPLPPGVPGRRPVLPVAAAGPLADGLAWGCVRKYAGDDPDVTDGMLINALVYRGSPGSLEIDGGEGIGRVTLPGLAVPPGEAAINPAPRRQISEAVRELEPGLGLRVILTAPEGEARARGTMNGRLGIVGGISILGTHGVVKPFSAAAWKAALAEFVAVNRATGQRHVILTTGRRSLNFAMGSYPHLPDHAFMVAGDFVAEALEMAAQFEKISWGCFFGKLIKLAQGHANTHAHVCGLDLAFLARVANMPQLASLTTAQAALAVLLRENPSAICSLVALAGEHARKFAGRGVTIHLFHVDGRELASI